MVNNALIQKAIIARLNSDTSLLNWLTSYGTANEIKEVHWHSTILKYPNIRVQVTNQREVGNPPCFSECTFLVYCSSEDTSSKQADDLAYLVNKALIRKNLLTTNEGFTSGIITSGGALKAIRNGNIWRATNNYTVMIYGGF